MSNVFPLRKLDPAFIIEAAGERACAPTPEERLEYVTLMSERLERLGMLERTTPTAYRMTLQGTQALQVLTIFALMDAERMEALSIAELEDVEALRRVQEWVSLRKEMIGVLASLGLDNLS